MRLLILIALVFLSPFASAASFDCKKANAFVEKEICRSARLSALDDDLSAAYKAVSAGGADYEPLSISQNKWLKEKRAKCKDEACIASVYADRIAELKSWNKLVTPQDDIYGTYFLVRPNSIYEGGDKWGKTKTVDCFTLEKQPKGAASFRFTLVQTNGHICSLEGKLKRVGDRFDYIADPADEFDRNCKLKIKFKPYTIVLDDEDGGCKNAGCGARASIHGTEFLRSEKKSKSCDM